MDRGNQMRVSEFLLLGLSHPLEQQLILSGLFLIIYLVTAVGNLLIMLAICSDSHLHTPMYFFLANFSFTDVCVSSTTVLKMFNIQTHSQTICYGGCLTQIFFFLSFIGLDVFLLGIMAYDQLVAICHPLHYTILMSPQHCYLLVAVSLVMAHLFSLTHTNLLAQLPFCAANTIPHFFCELLPLMKLSCSEPYTNQHVLIYWGGALTILIPLMILISYVPIMNPILCIPSVKGKCKAFSTYGSHLSAVCLFYVAAIGVYFIPFEADSAGKDRLAAVMYAVVTPMLNPFIYTLRNTDMKAALGRILNRRSLLFL
ncbi:olfactory receptor 1G1-like [Monodelphis domestica]|uniref:Olfactory receptor 1G1-like n=1 Tax=Monodelphis domestica TaxID=13616 RepID=F6TC73_MONDO|nr:olfactory receptor 1G1-like [Monodelphis domestica]